MLEQIVRMFRIRNLSIAVEGGDPRSLVEAEFFCRAVGIPWQ